ncbi:unnamed protein product [Protopolystoma xenopodis]|uniref:Uncharacterized protein n=1 Tax=Protopolystoma xenopodis TaxID=117903 RepID=A0A3S4ZTD8_9PLAT|nr:unnamed protein product [Protopolystoma xenopodis]
MGKYPRGLMITGFEPVALDRSLDTDSNLRSADDRNLKNCKCSELTSLSLTVPMGFNWDRDDHSDATVPLFNKVSQRLAEHRDYQRGLQFRPHPDLISVPLQDSNLLRGSAANSLDMLTTKQHFHGSSWATGRSASAVGTEESLSCIISASPQANIVEFSSCSAQSLLGPKYSEQVHIFLLFLPSSPLSISPLPAHLCTSSSLSLARASALSRARFCSLHLVTWTLGHLAG